MTAAIAAGRRLFPRGYADFGYQLLIWFGFLAAYQVARGVADRDPSRAFANGWRVIGVEQRLAGLGELTLQGWTQSSKVLETLVSWTYWNSEFTVIGLALLWVYFRRNEAFTRFRNTILLQSAYILHINKLQNYFYAKKRNYRATSDGQRLCNHRSPSLRQSNRI